jgi:chemotaxis protein MotB
MARKKRHEEHVNHEAWAIPYGDLVTLLLAFFVVMYAMSSVNEGKYRVLSDSLVAAFRSAPKSLEPIQVGQLSRSHQMPSAEVTRTLVPLEIEVAFEALMDALNDPAGGYSEERDLLMQYMRETGLGLEDLDETSAMIEALSDALFQELSTLVEEDLVRLRQDRFWIEIEINTSVLFPTASADLDGKARDILRRVGDILVESDTRVYVEGHTDERPINTFQYPSNWELSGARASSVVRLFVDGGMAPQRLATVGHAEFQPVADSSTPEGLARNRRVVIVVMAQRQRDRTELGIKRAEAEAGESAAALADRWEPRSDSG